MSRRPTRSGSGWEAMDPESFDRPRRRTRPRTKDRPSHDDAVLATVVTVDRGRLTCVLEGNEPGGSEAQQADQATQGVVGEHGAVFAMKSRNLGRKGVVVGDLVRLVGDTSGADGSLARIVAVEPRRALLRRTADDDDPVERVIVANADQLVVVVAVADPEPRTGLIDRALVAAYDAGIEPLLVLTKTDLASPADLLEVYRPLEVRAVATYRGADVANVAALLAGRTSVLLGHSGVGKSTLVNALVPGAERATGDVNDVTGRGRHTSTSALMLSLPGGGRIVDTPGIRSFGLAHVGPQSLLNTFNDLVAASQLCPRGCDHGAEAPECGLDAAARSGDLDRARVDSYRRLLASR